jgi:transcriptional regulator with XRE-family HTH domain
VPVKRFGDELRRLRRQADLNLADLADAIDCSIAFISDVERGRKNPPVGDKLRKLLKKLKKEDKYDEFELMAFQARESIEISMKDKGEDEANLLLALARRCDEGGLDPETARKLRKLLEEDSTK